MQFLVIDGNRQFLPAQPDGFLRGTAEHVNYIRSQHEARLIIGSLRCDYESVGELWLGDGLGDGQPTEGVVDALVAGNWSPLRVHRIFLCGHNQEEMAQRLRQRYGAYNQVQLITNPEMYLQVPGRSVQAA